MDYDLKVYDMLGFNARHIDTIDKVYGSIIDTDFNLEDQPKRIRKIIRHLAELPKNLRPKLIFESSVVKPARKLRTFARTILTAGKHKLPTRTNHPNV